MRLSIAAAACLSIVGVAAADQAAAAIKKFTDIPAQELGSALQTLAQERDFQVVYLSDSVDTLKTSGAVGEFTADEALKKLLRGTGLSYRYLDEKTITVWPARGGAATSSKGDSGIRAKAEGDGASAAYGLEESGDPEVGKDKSFWDRFRVAQAETNSSSSFPGTSPGGGGARRTDEDKNTISEIIVTAQKREERLQDVPVPVTVLDPETLAERDQNRLQDYFATVPGLNLNANGGGEQTLSIRGIATGGATNPSVGMTIDDVPYGSSSQLGDGQVLYPDIDPSDLARIEVLKGPQGTLYGASSIGGLIKFVTKDPSTDGFSGRVQVLGDNVYHGDTGYGVRGAVNVPMSDAFAIRASGFTRRDPGYIDNVTTGQSDVNRVDASGGRVSALWRPSDVVSLKFSAMLQNTQADGAATVDSNSALQPILGDRKQAELRGTGEYTSKVQLYAATLTAKLSGLDFISISSYGTSRYIQFGDATLALGATSFPPNSQTLFGVASAYTGTDFLTKKFTQEFRLSSASGQTLEWLVGAFYTHENTAADEFYEAADTSSGAAAGTMINFNFPSTLSEYAEFADLTYHVTDRFDVQVGGRESEHRQVAYETDTGPLTSTYDGANPPYMYPTVSANANAFTYLLTPRFKISSDLMVYARLASGYRLGGANSSLRLGNVPIKYDPDKTNNYELGVKADLFDHRLTVDASAYYIAWKRIQLSFFDTETSSAYQTNGGDAKSQGLELSLNAQPVRGLTIAATASVNDAELTQNLPSLSFAPGAPPAGPTVLGSAGDRLPFSSRFSGGLSINQDIPVTSDWTGFAGAAVSYVGERQGVFVSAFSPMPRTRYPAYADVDLHTGARQGSWIFNLFVNNVADRRGILGGGPNNAESPYDVVFIQPRTVGLSIAKSFD